MTQRPRSQPDAATRQNGQRTAARARISDSRSLPLPGRWAELALCASADPDTWFPEQGHNGRTAIAKRICGACPVRAECLEYALSGADTWKGITTGIWGGTTPRQRARLCEARKAAAA